MLLNLLLGLFAVLAGVLLDTTRPIRALPLARPGTPSLRGLVPAVFCLALLARAQVALASCGPLPPPVASSSSGSLPAAAEDIGADDRGGVAAAPPSARAATAGLRLWPVGGLGSAFALPGTVAAVLAVSPGHGVGPYLRAPVYVETTPATVAAVVAVGGQKGSFGLGIKGVFAGFGHDLRDDKAREHLNSLFYYLLGIVTVCQYFRGDFDGEEVFEEDEDDDDEDDEWEDIEDDDNLNNLLQGIDDDDTDWHPPENAIAIVDINPADGQRRIVWANPEDIWGNPDDIRPEEADDEAAEEAEDEPAWLLDLAVTAIHPLCLAWHLVAIWAFRPHGALPWFEVFRLVQHGIFVAVEVFGPEWLPRWSRHFVRCIGGVGCVWTVYDGVRGGKRPMLLQVAASGMDLWLWGKFQLYLLRKWRERR